MTCTLLLLVSLQEPSIDDLVRQLGSDDVDVRERATDLLKAAGSKALPLLRKRLPESTESESRARLESVVAYIDWSPYVPLWVEDEDRKIFEKLASSDDATAAAGYDLIVRRSDSVLWGFHRKALTEGAPGMRRRALAQFDGSEWSPGGIGFALRALTSLDVVDPEAVKELPSAVIQSVRAENEADLRALAKCGDEFRPTVARLGLAALGDADALKSTLADLAGAPEWRRLAAIEVFARTKSAEAGPILRDLLQSRDSKTVLKALDALAGYPDVDPHESLVNLLSYTHEEKWIESEVHEAALRNLAARKIDEAERVWSLIVEGKIEGAEGALEGKGGSRLDCLPGRVAQALLVADDPAYIERLDDIEVQFWLWSGFDAAMREEVGPRVRAWLKEPAEDATWKKGFANTYFRHHPEAAPRPDNGPILDRLVNAKDEKTLKEAWTELLPRDKLAPDEKRRFLDLCRAWIKDDKHPLRTWAAWALGSEKDPEATEILLELAREDTHDAGNILFTYFQNDDRAIPIYRGWLKSKHEMNRMDAVCRLASKADEAVIPVILESARAGKGNFICLLRYFKDRDFTDELFDLLEKGAPKDQRRWVLDYIRDRGRKDKIEFVRTEAFEGDSEARTLALCILGEWKDTASFEKLEAMPTKDVVETLAEIDASRARPHVLKLLRSRKYEERRTGYRLFAKAAGPDDRDFLMRLLHSDTRADFCIPQAAARLGCEGLGDMLLENCGVTGDVAVAFGYLGERRFLRYLVEGLDRHWPGRAAASLDYIVHRDRYPSLTARKDLGRGSVELTDAIARMKSAFGVVIRPHENFYPMRFTFEGEMDIVEAFDRQNVNSIGGSFAPIARDGAIELVKIEDAKAYWKAWWAEHAKEFE